MSSVCPIWVGMVRGVWVCWQSDSFVPYLYSYPAMGCGMRFAHYVSHGAILKGGFFFCIDYGDVHKSFLSEVTRRYWEKVPEISLLEIRLRRKST